jgi:hypothetical protein
MDFTVPVSNRPPRHLCQAIVPAIQTRFAHLFPSLIPPCHITPPLLYFVIYDKNRPHPGGRAHLARADKMASSSGRMVRVATAINIFWISCYVEL